IGRNARAQKQLVEDLLDVARIASGRLELQPVPLDLAELSRAAVDSALPAAQGRDITLSFIGQAPVRVTGDTNRLQQALANLISNALKFTDPGGRITVTVARRSGRADVAVSDTGIGMSAEFLPSAFDRFRQADGSLTRAYPGLGLGLWLVKQIVDAHHGHVTAESRGEGQGSTVTVSLPLAAEERR
ncbi:MAG TPA: HAMP domain-containing sensor histidine kinase, partial [Vicinamibacterales bacterium]